MTNLVDYKRLTAPGEGGMIAVIAVNNPPVNALTVGVPQGILDALDLAYQDAAVSAVILAGGGRGFIAGADINEFLTPPPAGSANIFDVIDALDAAPKPVIAAIHGNALGGGLEVAMACHYRCALAEAMVGLPEIKLGLLPGAGGTQRLPRLVGIEAALPLIASGDFVPAARAEALGIIDRVIESPLIESAAAYAGWLVATRQPLRRARDLSAKAPAAAGFFDDFAKSMRTAARGQIAPELIVDCVKAALTLPFDQGIARERANFRRCLESPQSKALIHLFFAERNAAKIPDVPRQTKRMEIKHAAVIGAGTMGGGIAMNFANAGIPVTLVEINEQALGRGLGTIRANYASTVKRGRLSQHDMDARVALIHPTIDEKDVADADVVIEAVFEDMEVKKDLFAKLDRLTRKDAILASNTSTLDIDQIAAATKRPGQVIGTHFFSPANVMRLLEVVRGAKTSKETIATVMDLGKTIGKVPVLVGVCDGFVGNRMLVQYLRQAHAMLAEGALPREIDQALYDFGLAMGPFAMIDLAGLDVGWRIRKRRMAERGTNVSDAPIEDLLCERGRFGQKTGAGWYRYRQGSRAPEPDPEVEALILDYAKSQRIKRRPIAAAEIVERCLYQLVNEGAKILAEGIALRASDIDVIYANGYGFPRWRGGPMFHADQIGVDKVHESIRGYFEDYGEDWKPAPLLEKLAREGGRFNV